MSLRTLFEITTGDYEFNNINEFVSQLSTFGFELIDHMGEAQQDGRIQQSEISEISSNQFRILVIWDTAMIFYEMLVSEDLRQAMSYFNNIGWQVQIIEKSENPDS